MKKFLLLAALILATTLTGAAKKPTKSELAMQQFRYELECAGNGVQGTYLVRVWTYDKKQKDAQAACARNAVHGVIFKGFAGGDGCIGQKALVPTPGAEMEFEDYFRLFFSDNGEYRKYVSIVAGSELCEKVGKEYRAGAIVSIQKDELRKALEAAGIIKGLNYGF
ncbi:MAG: hypothetical protein J5635_05685 [Paludibacteraceae bacterium]|nr:hypothetical protein [Paludibacteraceae bacterium]